VDQGIGTLVIGYNPNWKQRVNNQEFVSIPHHKQVEMLPIRPSWLASRSERRTKNIVRNAVFWTERFHRSRRSMPGIGTLVGCFGLWITRRSTPTSMRSTNIAPDTGYQKAFPNPFEGIEGVYSDLPGYFVVHPVRVQPF
jgi:hypothetical protein